MVFKDSLEKLVQSSMFSRVNFWHRNQVVPNRRYHTLSNNPTLVSIKDIETLKLLYQVISSKLHSEFFRLKSEWFRQGRRPSHVFAIHQFKRPIALCELVERQEANEIEARYSLPDTRYSDESLFRVIKLLVVQSKIINDTATVEVSTEQRQCVHTNVLTQLGFIQSIGKENNWLWKLPPYYDTAFR